MPTVDLKFVEAYRASHPIQAHALRMALEESGIRVIIENEAMQGVIGEAAAAGWNSAPRLLVEESQLAAARAIISQTDHSERDSLGLKPHETAITMTAASLGLVGIALAALAPGAVAEPEPIETTHCLACNAMIAESETACPKCGWTYESDDSAELP